MKPVSYTHLDVYKRQGEPLLQWEFALEILEQCKKEGIHTAIETSLYACLLYTSSIGFLIATPHAKSVHVKEPSLAFARLKDPVQWANEKVQMVFQIAVPDPGQGDKHLEILAKLSRKIIHDDFREQLLSLIHI